MQNVQKSHLDPLILNHPRKTEFSINQNYPTKTQETELNKIEEKKNITTCSLCISTNKVHSPTHDQNDYALYASLSRSDPPASTQTKP